MVKCYNTTMTTLCACSLQVYISVFSNTFTRNSTIFWIWARSIVITFVIWTYFIVFFPITDGNGQDMFKGCCSLISTGSKSHVLHFLVTSNHIYNAKLISCVIHDWLSIEISFNLPSPLSCHFCIIRI